MGTQMLTGLGYCCGGKHNTMVKHKLRGAANWALFYFLVFRMIHWVLCVSVCACSVNIIRCGNTSLDVEILALSRQEVMVKWENLNDWHTCTHMYCAVGETNNLLSGHCLLYIPGSYWYRTNYLCSLHQAMIHHGGSRHGMDYRQWGKGGYIILSSSPGIVCRLTAHCVE